MIIKGKHYVTPPSIFVEDRIKRLDRRCPYCNARMYYDTELGKKDSKYIGTCELCWHQWFQEE